jgi:hypothetical protein
MLLARALASRFQGGVDVLGAYLVFVHGCLRE